MTGTRRLRIIGAVLGAGLSGVTVLVGWGSDASMLLLGGLVGVPTAGVLGWWDAPLVRTQTAGERFGSALGMAVVAVLIGDVLVTMAMTLGPNGPHGPELLVAWAVVSVIGLVIFGLPAFALAFVVLWPWTFLVRHLPGALVG